MLGFGQVASVRSWFTPCAGSAVPRRARGARPGRSLRADDEAADRGVRCARARGATSSASRAEGLVGRASPGRRWAFMKWAKEKRTPTARRAAAVSDEPSSQAPARFGHRFGPRLDAPRRLGGRRQRAVEVAASSHCCGTVLRPASAAAHGARGALSPPARACRDRCARVQGFQHAENSAILNALSYGRSTRRCHPNSPGSAPFALIRSRGRGRRGRRFAWCSRSSSVCSRVLVAAREPRFSSSPRGAVAEICATGREESFMRRGKKKKKTPLSSFGRTQGRYLTQDKDPHENAYCRVALSLGSLRPCNAPQIPEDRCLVELYTPRLRQLPRDRGYVARPKATPGRVVRSRCTSTYWTIGWKDLRPPGALRPLRKLPAARGAGLHPQGC